MTTPWPKWRIVQSSPKTPRRTTTSTQVKVRLISAAPSCAAVDFISIATGKYFRAGNNEQSVSCNNLEKETCRRGSRLTLAISHDLYAATPTRFPRYVWPATCQLE